MAGKKLQDRTFHIAVVGLSGDERTKGSVGVGKSCLCNRFVRPHADDFYKDHISIISQIDFSGRVINNDHFLYWGEVNKQLEDGSSVTCSIMELTEFIDDQSFQPLRGHGDKDYKKRCKSSLSSAEKLMYICKDQLGDEVNYDRKIMPDGKFVIDGFLVVFDVSHVQNRPPNKQYSFILDLLSGPLSKSKKPCVLVATKCEEPEEKALDEVRALKDKKKVSLVETSAFENVNVDFAFLTLVNLIDKNKKLPKEVPFINGIKKQKELLDKVEDAYMGLLNRTVTDYHDIWNRTKKKLVGEDHYMTYLKYFGSEIAAKKFKSHTKKLREDKQQWKKQQCLETLPKALEDMLPDLKSIDGRDWEACKGIMTSHPNYKEWFVQLPRGDAWRTSEYIDQTDHQIAVDFLKTNAVDCEKCFKYHENRLKEALKKERMKTEFRKLLKALSNVVLPGRPLQDTLTQLVDEESYQYLNQQERKEIYDVHQAEITEQGKRDFVEMLLENVETFEDFDMDNVNAHMEAIITHKLQKEPRYKYLDGLNQERRLLLMKHAAFVNNPCRQTCPSQTRCMDELINQTLEQKVTKCQEREIPERWSEPNSKLSIVVLGENGLADELVNEIRAQSVQEEYTLDNVIYALELRPIEGDLARPQNYLSTPDFTPQGCICTFSSPEDLAYIESSLKTSRLAVTEESKNDIYATLQPDMPVILLFARDLSVPESDLAQMKQDINTLAAMLIDCVIIDMPTDETTLWHGKKFHESQIRHAIRTIVDSRRSSSTDRDDDISHDGSQYDPDLRYGGDNQSLYEEIVLSNDKVQTFMGSSGNNTPTSRGSDDLTAKGETQMGSGQTPMVQKVMKDLTDSESQFKSHSAFLAQHKVHGKSSLGTGNGSGTEHPSSEDDDIEGDDPILRIGMALMCGDQNLPDLVLGPIISNDTCCRDMDLKQTVNIDMFLNTVKRRVSIEITSFHQANLYTQDVHHGYILVYSAKRRASFETLKFFVKSVTPIPVEIVAVSDSEKFSSDYEMQALIAEGNKLADETKNCTFIIAGANFCNQSLAYSTFFTEAHEKIFQTEKDHDDLFGPFGNQDEDIMDEERQGIRTPIEPPPAGFEEYSKPIVKGVAYKPVIPNLRARALSAGESPSVPPPPPSRYDHLVRPSDIKSQQKRLQDKKGEENLYDQPERYPLSPRRLPPNKGEAPTEPVYGTVQKPKTKPEPASRRRNSSQTSGSKGDGEAGKSNRRSLHFRSRRTSSTRSSEAEDDQGFVNNPLYSAYTGPSKGAKQGNGSTHYASTRLYDDHQSDMVPNPIYDSVEQPPAPFPANRFHPSGKPIPPPKPKPSAKLNMANFQNVADKLSKPRDGTPPGVGPARPNHLPFSTTPRRPRAPLATPEKGGFTSPKESLKHVHGMGECTEAQDALSKVMRQGQRPKVHPEDANSDNEPSEPIYAVANKKKGNAASSDSDSKGSIEADRDHQKKKRNSFRRKKNRDHPAQADDASPHHKPHLESRIYDMPGTFSPDEDEVNPKARKRQQMEEEKNRRKEEKRQIAANKKRDKAQRQQQRQSKRQKTKKKAPAYAGYLDKPKGIALEELVTESDPLPKIVQKCIEFIDREGISQEGIYRVSGKSADCDALTERFENDPNISIESMEISVHAVASAVKQFFKHLPDPLIPHELQGELLQMFKGKSQEDFLEAMPEFFNKLPPIRLAILKFLMQHFGRVIVNSEVNKMSEQNLTVCWWPTLLHPQFKSLEDVANETQLSAFVELWVKHSVKLFGTGVEEQEAPEEDSPIYDQSELIQGNPSAEVNKGYDAPT
ncbi:rho GTPase-activating protein 5-like isoform X3 [Asterias rubens]|uniref:rho GTPase-activating protein 5-like isoform X3 n=1 Tax=Asterias rubens TaxID=7604 RepID=UPI0014557627|nr:rho GTPase-activating protein 5-like isoform X3 [Asterias rubens]